MKSIATFVAAIAAILGAASCHSLPRYTGEGSLTKTTTRHDGLVRIPEYTVRLKSFGLDENISQEFYLGSVGFFSQTTLGVYLRFTDVVSWEHFAALPPSMKTDAYVARHELRAIDGMEARFSYEVLTEAGDVVFRSDKPLRDFTWGRRSLADGLQQFDIYDRSNARREVPHDASLRLRFSYSGTHLVTNRVELVLVFWPK